eukprot:c28352_g1_i1 orf=394-2625(-)
MASTTTPYIPFSSDVSDSSFRLGKETENGDSDKRRESSIPHREIWINRLFCGQEVYMIDEPATLHGAVDIWGGGRSEVDWITNNIALKLLCNEEITGESDTAKIAKLSRHQQDYDGRSTFFEHPPCSGEMNLFGAGLHGTIHSGEDENPVTDAIGKEGVWTPNCYPEGVHESVGTFRVCSSENKSSETAWDSGHLWWNGASKACYNENQRIFTTDQNILDLGNIERCEFPEGIWLEHVIGKSFTEDGGVPKWHGSSENCSVGGLLWGTVVQQLHGNGTDVWREGGEVTDKEEIKADAQVLKGHGSGDNHAIGGLLMGTLFPQMHANSTATWSGGTEATKEEEKFRVAHSPQVTGEEGQWLNDIKVQEADLNKCWGKEQGGQQYSVAYNHDAKHMPAAFNNIANDTHSCTGEEIHVAEACVKGKLQGEKEDRECFELESGFDGMPPYALFYTFSYLSLQDLLTIEIVCKSFRNFVRDDTSLWLKLHVEPPLSKRLTDEVFLQLAARAKGQLQCLSLVDCFRVTENAVEQVVRSNPRLFKLCLPGCSRVSAEAVMRMVKEHVAHKATGMVGLTQLRIRNIYGLTREHLDGLHSILGHGLQTETTSHQPQFYHNGHSTFSCDDQRPIDVEACPKCGNARVVYDCTRDRCQQRQGSAFQQCRGCIFCIARCEECGRCINDNDYEETFCLDLLCSACWLRLPKCAECNRPGCGRHADHFIRTPETTFVCGDCCGSSSGSSGPEFHVLA